MMMVLMKYSMMRVLMKVVDLWDGVLIIYILLSKPTTDDEVLSEILIFASSVMMVLMKYLLMWVLIKLLGLSVFY